MPYDTFYMLTVISSQWLQLDIAFFKRSAWPSYSAEMGKHCENNSKNIRLYDL